MNDIIKRNCDAKFWRLIDLHIHDLQYVSEISSPYVHIWRDRTCILVVWNITRNVESISTDILSTGIYINVSP